jgi:stage II sporulation protein D
VLETRGQVLRYQGRPLRAFYHSCCGGAGESLDNVWQDLAPGKSPPPFPPAVSKDPFCKRSPHYRWEATLSNADLVSAMHSRAPQLHTTQQISFEPDPNGRVTAVALAAEPGAIKISGNQFRKALGYDVVRSTWFIAKHDGYGVHLKGRGYGHGVGMCQWGARGMAEKGKSAQQILNFYYPGTTVLEASHVRRDHHSQ